MSGGRAPLLLLGCLLSLGSGCLGRLTPSDRAQLAEQLATRPHFAVDPPSAQLGPPVPAGDPRIAAIGRLERVPLDEESGREALLLSWPGSELRARFRGAAIAIELVAEGEVHFDVLIDEASHLLSPRGAGLHRYAVAAPGPGPHLLRLRKRTEAAAGVARIASFSAAADGEVLAAPPLPDRKLEFIGDSMTVGACVYDDGAERWDRRETHAHGASFAALTAAALGAQHRAIAVSGLGVSRSKVPMRAQQIFDRCRPDPQSAREPRESWQPDAVIVFLGHNDVIAGRGFPRRFAADYVRLIRAVRGRYPHSLILCLTGGMWRSRHSPALFRAFAAALRELEVRDVRIFSYRFRAWSFLHPRAHTQAQLAAELRPLLAALLGW